MYCCSEGQVSCTVTRPVVRGGRPALRGCLGWARALFRDETDPVGEGKARKQARSLAVRLQSSFSALDDKERWSDAVLD